MTETARDVKVLLYKGGIAGDEYSQDEHRLVRKMYEAVGRRDGVGQAAEAVYKARLPYRTETLELDFKDRPLVYRDIPLDVKKDLYRVLFVFDDCPDMDEEVIDIHCRKAFKFKDAMVIHEPWNGYNYLVSPYYAESGGMAVDMMTYDMAVFSAVIAEILNGEEAKHEDD